MKVKSFAVKNFRNIQDFSFQPGDGINIIYGNNAQGKTNLLEAIWLFSGARSFRGGTDRDFLQKGKEFASLELEFQGCNRRQTASVRYGENQRTIALNEIKETSYSAFSGIFCAVIFSPDHLSLVKDGPDVRRQMIDISLTQAYPKYAKALDNYTKALRQRNRLLKDIPENQQLKELLGLWDDHIINYGGYISVLRARYCRQLALHAGNIYQGISSGKETLTLTYQPSVPEPKDQLDLESFQKAIEKGLKENRNEDLRYGNTSVGPHRDDLLIEINGLSAREFGSQGQQRSAVLALKLAEAAILEEQTGEPPVIMLDDVMSELDEHRRSYLLNKLENKQTFITCCDSSAWEDLENGTIFQMKQGMLTEIKNEPWEKTK